MKKRYKRQDIELIKEAKKTVYLSVIDPKFAKNMKGRISFIFDEFMLFYMYDNHIRFPFWFTEIEKIETK